MWPKAARLTAPLSGIELAAVTSAESMTSMRRPDLLPFPLVFEVPTFMVMKLSGRYWGCPPLQAYTDGFTGNADSLVLVSPPPLTINSRHQHQGSSCHRQARLLHARPVDRASQAASSIHRRPLAHLFLGLHFHLLRPSQGRSTLMLTSLRTTKLQIKRIGSAETMVKALLRPRQMVMIFHLMPIVKADELEVRT